MTAARWLLAPALMWAGYTWGSHLLTLGCIWTGRGEEHAATLTFDDGPDPEYTPRVLDVLGRHGVRGAFFLIGERARRAPGVVGRIVAEGHDLGNHTWSHRSLWLCGPAETARQVREGHDAIADTAGQAPRFFRPPWGMTNMASCSAGWPPAFLVGAAEGRRAVLPAAGGGARHSWGHPRPARRRRAGRARWRMALPRDRGALGEG